MAHSSAASETRTLHALAFPARLSDPGAGEPRRGLYVDCETTGFSPEHDAVIELALLPFTYTLAGTVVEVLHDEAQAHRNDPGRPLSPHGRGNLRRGRSARRMAGSIPARAGEPPTAGPASPSTRVYPARAGEPLPSNRLIMLNC